MMFKLGIKPITQNTSNLIRQIDTFEQTIEPLFTSHLLGEGVYGFEILVNSDLHEQYLISPSLFREDIGMESVNDFSYLKTDYKDLFCYDISLTKPTFLPLHTKDGYSLLGNLMLLHQKDSELFIQLLFTQRKDSWQEELLEQYLAYIQGNDYPSPNKLGRSFQNRMLKVINKAGRFQSFKRKQIPEIEQKILDNGYRYELRVIIACERGDVGRFETELTEVLKEMDYFNELRFTRMRNKKQFIDNFLERRFSDYTTHQMLSELELMCMLTDEKVVSSVPNDIVQVAEEIKENVVNSQGYSKIIELLPVAPKKNREVDNEIVAELPTALKKARAIKNNQLEVLDVEVGATVQRITFKIPKDVVYSDIKGKYEDIKSSLGTELSILQGKEPNTVTFLIPCKEREVIYLKELLENVTFLQYAKENPLPFVAGIDMYNEPVYKCLTKAPHLLVAGSTGSGKSVFLNALLITLILLKHPSELRLFLIDPKKVEFIQYEGFSHVEKIVTDMKLAEQVLDSLIVEMESRYEKFAKLGVRKISAYNNKSKQKMPYIVCAIDEYNDLKMVFPDVEERIERLGQKARASGIHLILATQRPDKDVMSGVIKTNLPSRISFKLDNTNEYRTVFGTGIPYKNLLGLGDGVVKYIEQKDEFVRFQAPVITLNEDEEEKVFEKIKKVYKGDVVEKIEIVEVAEEEPIDKLKRIIANQRETRVAKLREEMGIRINVVQELVQQLVDEDWLKKENNRYEIVASEEELGKYRVH